MTDHNTTLKDDIAFLRNLAESGGRAPMMGGSILLAAGLIYATCAFATWAATFGVFGAVSGLFMPLLWFGGTGVFVAILFAIKSRLPDKSNNSRAAGLVWAGAGWAMFAVVLSLMLMAYRANAWWIMGAICPLVMATYGAAWTVAGLLAGQGWMRVVGLAAFAMTLVCAWFAQDVRTLFLVYGVSLLGLVALPGLVVMRQARAAA